MSISDAIATFALLLSGYATWKTIQFNKRQQSLIESQDALNRRLLDRDAADAAHAKKADLGASFVRLGSGNYRLKIWNKGRASAHNVSIEFPEGNECIDEHGIAQMFPLEALDPQQGVELIAIVHMGTKKKQAIKLLWTDGFSQENEKTVYPTL